MKAIEEKVGIEAWEKMGVEERNRKYMVYRGDCWQHLRNIIVDAMAKVRTCLGHALETSTHSTHDMS